MTIKRRFTLLLSGDDAATDSAQETPTRGLPHERFLLGKRMPAAPFVQLGLRGRDARDDASTLLACIEPVHLHATRDHLVLMHHDQIPLTEKESAALLQEAQPFFEETLGEPVLAADPHHWFVPAAGFASLATHTIDQAHGRNIDWWLPRDTDTLGAARAWRKLQNEIQMLWHISDVNAARQEQGLPAINSIWISGIGSLQDLDAPVAVTGAKHIITDYPLLNGIASHLGLPQSASPEQADLIGGFAWMREPATLWPLIQAALADETLDEFELIDFPGGRERIRLLQKADITKGTWAFWRKPVCLEWLELIGTPAK